ncbi:MAG: helix-turn-helix domain-containing protein [Haliscomenobacter sp.]|uniref:helix-turn-helix domain-containing protein n=1 Tax=Haliscomenobacter sp. TaxID=2717303 RepID=UPI0029B84A5D|nr:helix-turn-helix domain-containing protein [Haliscomenobacter sp.]MDX2071722.1 helix-turn-helix domain-containing protein [Haliscomenobacter sp.]
MARYRIYLNLEERETLLDWVKSGKRKAQHIQYCHILLNSDESVGRKTPRMTDIADRYQTSTRTVERVKKAFCDQGMCLFEAKERKTRSDKKIDARAEAHVIALLCQSPPDDAPRWKLQMLADRLVELEVVDSISKMSISKLLKKMNLSPSKKHNT